MEASIQKSGDHDLKFDNEYSRLIGESTEVHWECFR